MTDEQPLTLSEPRARWKHSWSHREGDPRWDLTVPKFPFSTPAFIPQASHSSDFTTVFTPTSLPTNLAGTESLVWLSSMPSIAWHAQPWTGRVTGDEQGVTRGSPAPDTVRAVRQALPCSDEYLKTTGQGRWEGKQRQDQP